MTQSSRRTVFVTGATGLLGNHLVRQLLERGDDVRALVRDEKRARSLLPTHPRLELVMGELGDVEAFSPSLAGVDVLFHSAAFFRDALRGGNHDDRLHAINVEGTRALVAAAYERGVRRILHVSTIGTLVTSTPDGSPVTGDMRRDPTRTNNDYYRSKILADRVIEEALREHSDLWAAFVLPGFINGPGDAGPTSAATMIMDFVGGRVPGVLDAHFSFVDARDVAFACIEASSKAERGARYVVAGRRGHLSEEFAILERITGVSTPRRRMPLWLLGVFAFLQEVWARTTGRQVLIGLAVYRLIRDEGAHARFDSTPAERELGVRFRPLEETLRDAYDWLVERKMITARVEHTRVLSA